MRHLNKKISRSLLLSLAAVLTLSGASCSSSNTPGQRLGNPTPITLNYWTYFNSGANFDKIITDYRLEHPNVTINIRVLRYEEYESTLVNALAEDRGPDIFTIPNNAVLKYQPKLAPMPATTMMEQATTLGTLKKQEYAIQTTYTSPTLRQLKETFVDQVINDAYYAGKIWGLPLSMDTMALYYNKDILNASGISEPAKNYQELQEHVIKTTKLDGAGNILQSGVALGTANNVTRFADIIALLMMQSGTIMTNDSGAAAFHQMPPNLKDRTTLPGADALYFFTDFASPSKQVYTWNSKLPNSLQDFMAGKVAYMFGYAYQLPVIRAQAPKLNFAIAKMPQIPGNTVINFANYNLETVSVKSKNIDAAWNFLQFATKADEVKNYLASAKLPTAVRSLIASQQDDLDLGPFADQVLTAVSWYHGRAPEAIDTIFAEMVSRAQDGALTPEVILANGANKINQTLR